MFNGTEPFFFRDPCSEPMIHYELGCFTVDTPDLLKPEPWVPVEWNLNADLLRAWTVMKRFCSTINSASKRNRRLPKEILLNTMASVMYRLLGMKDFDTNSANEAIRLGLLAFTSHIFLDFQNMKPPQKVFPMKYRECLQNIECPADAAFTMLWLLTIGAISVFTPTDDHWLMPLLRDHMRYCQISEWEDLRGHLKCLLWIGVLHDKPGERVFRTVGLPLSCDTE